MLLSSSLGNTYKLVLRPALYSVTTHGALHTTDQDGSAPSIFSFTSKKGNHEGEYANLPSSGDTYGCPPLSFFLS